MAPRFDAMPHLRLELEGVKQSMVVALMDAQGELHAATTAALREALEQITPEMLHAMIQKTVEDGLHAAINTVLPTVIESAVQEYFTTGAGGEFVMDAIRRRLQLSQRLKPSRG